MSRFSRCQNALIVLAILTLALVLRLFDLGNESLWLDEAYSWWDARQPLPVLWELVPQCDPHPPLYAFLLKGWTALFGDGILLLRGLSVLFNLVAVYFVYRAGREISPRVGWIGGLLFALAPFQIEYSQETRPYALVGLGGALLLFGLLRLLPARETDSRRAGWAALIAGGCISLWSNSTSVFLIAGTVVAVAVLLWRDPANRPLGRGFFIAGAVVGLLWLPYVPTLFQQTQSVAAEFWIPRPDNWWRIFNELRFLEGFNSFQVLWFLLPLWGLGLIALWREGKKTAAWILFALFLFPILFNLAASLVFRPVFLARALTGLTPAFTLALAAAFAALSRRSWLAAGLATYALSGLLFSAQALYFKDRKEPWREIAAALSRDLPAHSLVLVVPNEMVLPLRYALKESGKNMEIHGIPADFPAPGWKARYPSGKCAPAVSDQDLSLVLRAAGEYRHLILLTRTGNVYDPRNEVLPALEAAGFKAVGMSRFMPGAIEAYRFEAPKVMQGAK